MTWTMKTLAAAALTCGSVLAVPPMPKAEEMAGRQPQQPGVEVTTLAPADVARCRVEPYPNAANPVGYVLMDGANKPVRRFVSVKAQGFNILSYYNDGEEVYRETDSTGGGKIDQYRWLGSAGGKIGRDVDGNGSIDVWEAISAEEVSKELFEAMVTKDAKRLNALMPSDAELTSLGLPAAEIARIKGRLQAVGNRFAATSNALALTNKAKWVHVELWQPETTPADAFGGTADIIRHRNATVLADKGEGKAPEQFSTGELLRVGNSWRIIDGPEMGVAQLVKGSGKPDIIPDVIKPLLDELLKIKDDGTVKYHTSRAAVLEQIVAKLNGNPAQEQWMRQLLDAHGSAADMGDKPSAERLNAWTENIVKAAPKAAIAPFAIFRNLSVQYALKLKDAKTPKDMGDVQDWWRSELEKFVQNYPGTDDTAEALFRLAMAHEFNGKPGEQAAIGHYSNLAKTFPNHPLASQSAGAALRLDSVGKPFSMPQTTELATGKPFDPKVLGGKAVIVYYWGSFQQANGSLKNDSTALADLAKKHAGKLEIVTITLDVNPQVAVAAINSVQLPGTHLTSPNGAAAAAWGVMGQHIFLLDKTGKVDNKNANIATMGDDIERLVK